MEARLLVVRRTLEEIGVPVSIETVSDRIKVQKAIYLAQRAGVDLGYSYGWYRRGPYSPRLTRDYFEMRDQMAIEGESADPRRLSEPLAEVLRGLQSLITPPSDVKLPQDRWLELVVSVAYLAEEEGLKPAEVDERISMSKPRLAPYIEQARRALGAAPVAA